MIARSLFTQHYRNLAPDTVEFAEGVNVISGQNGQGKTNLLEALCLFTGVRSFRGAKNAELIARGEKFARMELQFFADQREQNADLVITDKKQATLNGVKLAAATGFIGRFCAVVFSPDNMSLVKGGSAERRRFLDAAISQQFPAYPRLLVEYNRILAQRNAFLKKSSSTAGFESMLDIWDENLARTGAKIACKRAEYVARLCGKTEEIFDGISSGRDCIRLRYSCGFLNPDSVDETARALQSQLEAHRASDLAQGCTNYGAHRDDLHISVNDMAARSYASQGQKRSCVLALKLAEASLLEEAAGERPIAVLDDVMSELDGLRQDYLLNHMEGWQVFISCCDPHTVKGLDKGRVIEVEDGKFNRR
ncbi:MAG: DNA replication/repair protein RecF [Clostridia bacterium]|nr:DNA replication/repair protein RecF [Clostridia bacterium]